MHYEKSYKDMSDAQKVTAAINDIIEWLGAERYATLCTQFKDCKNITCQTFSMYCSIAGIQGFPVIAWYEQLYQKKWKYWDDEIAEDAEAERNEHVK